MNWELHAQAWTYIGWLVLFAAATLAACLALWAAMLAWGWLEAKARERGGWDAVARLRVGGSFTLVAVVAVLFCYGMAYEAVRA